MEIDREQLSSYIQGICRWKAVQRRLSLSDSLFEAGDIACRVRVHKYVCDPQSYSSNSGIHASVE